MAAPLSERSMPNSNWATKTPFYYGWVVVAMGALTMFFTTPGQSDAFGMFMDSFVEDLGWNRGFVSSIYSGATLLSGFMMFFVGRLVDRIGAKWVAILAAALLGIACMVLSFVVSPIMLFGGFFLARFSGKGSMDLAASTLAPQWFIKRRAFSIMLVGLGGTLGGAAFPLFINFLINTYGWRQAYQILAGSLWVIYIPITLLFLIGRPEDVGLVPDAYLVSKEEQPSSKAPSNEQSSNDWSSDEGASSELSSDETALNDAAETHTVDEISFTQEQAIRTSAFWIVAFALFQASLVGTGIVLHFVSIFKELGFTMTFAAQIMSIKPLIAFVTVVVAGLSLDRIKQQNMVVTVACMAQVVSYIMLIYLSSVSMAFIYALVSGVSSALLMLSLNVLKPNLFGRRYLGGILGVLVAINVVGSAIGPIVFGTAFDWLGGYTEVILACALMPLIAGILSLALRKPQLQV
ncbi:MAG: MFS transporter [Chloroflexota bacterium]